MPALFSAASPSAGHGAWSPCNLPAWASRYSPTSCLAGGARRHALSGATLRIFFFIPSWCAAGGAGRHLLSTASLLIPAIGIGMVVQDQHRCGPST